MANIANIETWTEHDGGTAFGAGHAHREPRPSPLFGTAGAGGNGQTVGQIWPRGTDIRQGS
jgi:hypothetical protein